MWCWLAACALVGWVAFWQAFNDSHIGINAGVYWNMISVISMFATRRSGTLAFEGIVPL